MSHRSHKIFEFGEFRLDAGEQVLTRSGELVPLSPKVFQTLHLLVERHGHIVSKAEVMDTVWPDLFVEESNLTQNIYILRKVLGADKNVENFIETVPRRGYRFVAPVRAAGIEDRTSESEYGNDLSPSQASSALVAPQPIPAKSVNKKRIPSGPLVFIVVAVLLGLGIAGYKLFFPSNDKQTAAPIERVNFQKLTFTGDLTFPVIAPDGRSLAFVRSNQIIIQEIASAHEMPLDIPGHSVFGPLQYSRDSNWIYFRDQVGFDIPANVFRVTRFGGQPVLIAENVWSGFAFSPDSRHMSFVRRFPNSATSSVILRDLENGEERAVATLSLPSTFLDNGYPAWSSDGKRIAVIVFRNTPGAPVSELLIIDADTGNADVIRQPQIFQFEQAVWLPDNAGLIVSAREAGKFFQLWRIAYPSGALQRITNDLNIYRGVSLSADGERLLARQFTLYSHIWTGAANDLQNLEQRTFGNLNRDGVGGLDWTPEGDVLYVARVMENYDIWLYRPSDDSRRQITKNAGEINRTPVVSPDGKYIFFDSNRTGNNHIWQMDVNGEDQRQITFGEKEIELYPQISPDGEWLYYIQKAAAASRVWRRSLKDGRSEPLTDSEGFAPDSFLSLSPDGRFLAFHNAVGKAAENEGGATYQVAIISTDKHPGTKFVKISASRLIVRWSHDGSALDYIANTAGNGQIWRQMLAGNTTPTLLVDLPKAFLHNFAWSADGEDLVLSRGQQANDAILLTNFQP